MFVPPQSTDTRELVPSWVPGMHKMALPSEKEGAPRKVSGTKNCTLAQMERRRRVELSFPRRRWPLPVSRNLEKCVEVGLRFHFATKNGSSSFLPRVEI